MIRQARMKALHKVFPEIDVDEDVPTGHISYPRPISEPPSAATTRPASPHSLHEDEHDSEEELEVLQEVVKKLATE